MLQLTDDIKIPNRKIKSILNDAVKSAAAINLDYVNDAQPGITRIKKGEHFHYFLGKRKVQDKAILDRIKKLVIPPAWENVWICDLDNGHLQATGTDVKKRKQYKYHVLWNSLRNLTKFYRLYEFGKAIPAIRQQLEKDLSLPGLPVEKILATVVCLMEKTHIRIGNSAYEKLYGSFGLTTLKNKHVKIDEHKLQFMFKGKKGISHNINIKSKRLAKIVQSCRDIPGKELFQYYDSNGDHKCIDSGMVNTYIKNISGQDFTAKDFRTWAGTVHAISEFKAMLVGEAGNESASHSSLILAAPTAAEPQKIIKKNIVTMLDQVAKRLGNTPTVCRKYYVHPLIIDLYEKNTLSPYLKKVGNRIMDKQFSSEENLLMWILEKERAASI